MTFDNATVVPGSVIFNRLYTNSTGIPGAVYYIKVKVDDDAALRNLDVYPTSVTHASMTLPHENFIEGYNVRTRMLASVEYTPAIGAIGVDITDGLNIKVRITDVETNEQIKYTTNNAQQLIT